MPRLRRFALQKNQRKSSSSADKNTNGGESAAATLSPFFAQSNGGLSRLDFRATFP
jgi:hypothetical protein